MTMMRDDSRIGAQPSGQLMSTTEPCPPVFLEYMWHATFAYSILGRAWGIVIPVVGGAAWIFVATACLVNVANQSLRVYKPIALALCTGLSVLAIEFIFFEPGQQAWVEIIAFISWLALLIIAQSLLLRPGFLHRFVICAFAIGLACVPYINLHGAGGAARAFADNTGIANGNVLGMWFGYCTVYFVFWGFQQQRPLLRTASWTAAIGCLYVVAITVSRAPLFAIVLACVVGFRSELKRSFVPVLSFCILTALFYISGVFDSEIESYVARGAEKSGRDRLWPVAIERFLDSPLIGVGLDNIKIKGRQQYINPHNGPLHIALGAGILPVICFLGYLGRAMMGAARIMQESNPRDVSVVPPLVVFALVEIMVLDATFMSPWTVVILGMAVSASSIKIGGRTRMP